MANKVTIRIRDDDRHAIRSLIISLPRKPSKTERLKRFLLGQPEER